MHNSLKDYSQSLETHMLLHVLGSRVYHKSIIFYLQTSESQYTSIQISHVIHIYMYVAWPCQYPNAVPAHSYPLQADETVVCSMEVPVSISKYYFIRCHYV